MNRDKLADSFSKKDIIEECSSDQSIVSIWQHRKQNDCICTCCMLQSSLRELIFLVAAIKLTFKANKTDNQMMRVIVSKNIILIIRISIAGLYAAAYLLQTTCVPASKIGVCSHVLNNTEPPPLLVFCHLNERQ